MISRLQRRHEKLLNEYLETTRQLGDAEENRASRKSIERLKVRERALVASIRRVRMELGLPETFDADMEFARLRSQERKSAGAQRADGLGWSERPRVRPVPTLSRRPISNELIDLTAELVSHAARFCARRAAEELLEHRRSPARGHPAEATAAWPQQPLALTANGEIYAGSAGRLMGELIARAHNSDDDANHARIAIRSYTDEFATCVIAALRREDDVTKRSGSQPDEHTKRPFAEVRQELIHAAHTRLAVEARAVSTNRSVTSDDVAAIARPPADHRNDIEGTRRTDNPHPHQEESQ